MPNARLHHSLSYGRHASLIRVLLPTLAAGVLLVGTSLGRASSAAQRFVEKVEATTGADGLQVELTTTAPATPIFSVFPLRNPNRLVMDIPGFAWKPGLTTHLSSASPTVRQIRIGQASVDPPVTRVVFDLSAPTKPFRYRAVTSTASGNLRVEFSDQGVAAQDPDGWLGIRTASAPLPYTANPPAAAAKTRAQSLTATRTAAAAPSPQAAPMTEPAQPTKPEPATQTSPPPASAVAGTAQAARQTTDAPLADRRPAAARTSPAARTSEPSAASIWDDPAIRFAAALAVIALAGIGAILARYRFQVSRRREPEAEREVEPDAVSHSDAGADTPTEGERPDLVRCKVIDGYLMLEPHSQGGETPAISGTTRATISRGTLELNFSPPKAEEQEQSVDDTPDVSTRIGDLVASLADGNIGVRRAAAEGLLEIAVAGQWSALRPYMQNSDPRVRSVVAGIMGDAGAIDALPEVARLATDGELSVRACVMYAFAQYGESAARYIGTVRTALSDSDCAVRAGAVEALAALSPKSEDTAEEVIHFTADPDPLVRQAAATATFGFALRGVAGPLLDLLADFARRAQALEMIQQADDAILWRLLLAARTSKSTSAQAAMDTLSYVMSRRWTADDFKEEIESSDPEARLTGVEGLSMVGGTEAAGHIRRLAESDPSPDVRKRASEIISQWQAWPVARTPESADTESLRTES